MFTGLILSKEKAPLTFKQRNGCINTILASAMLLIPFLMVSFAVPRNLLSDDMFNYKVDRDGFLAVVQYSSETQWVIGGTLVSAALSALLIIAIIRSVSLLSIKN